METFLVLVKSVIGLVWLFAIGLLTQCQNDRDHAEALKNGSILTCHNFFEGLDDQSPYQLLCAKRDKKENCIGYFITQGFGRVPVVSAPISNKPYMITTPDKPLNYFVDCNTFEGSVIETDHPQNQIPFQANNTDETNLYNNSYENLYDTKGRLFIDGFSLGIKNKGFCQDYIGQIKRKAEQYTKYSKLNVSDNQTSLFIDDVSLNDTFLLRHFHASELVLFRWSPNSVEGYVILNGY